MRVGLNLLYLLPGVVGGTETYARGLLQGLAAAGRSHDFFVFVSREAADWPLPERGGFERVACPVDAARRGESPTFERTKPPTLPCARRVDFAYTLYLDRRDLPRSKLAR